MNIYIETYGCQMNSADTEIVKSLLRKEHNLVESPDEADLVFLNTCSVRDNAERKIHERIIHLRQYRRNRKNMFVGILGCMAERLRERLVGERDMVRLVVGPDEYRKLPELIEEAARENKSGIAVELSTVETYEDIEPLRTDGISAFISIMRGCNNFCSYCVVPYTRGRERSRTAQTVIDETARLVAQGFREISLLGQNVNSYKSSDGFDFPELLVRLAENHPEIRFRFTTSHPKDFGEKLIDAMASHANICKHLHLPVQSGSSRILELMNRRYTAEQYIAKIDLLRSKIPNIALSTDIIAGYPDENEDDHRATLELMKTVKYDGAFMFKYSPREGTKSYKIGDTVSDEEKIRRLNEIIDLQQNIAFEKNQLEIGKIHSVMVENVSRRSEADWKGRTDTNKKVVFPVPADMAIAEGDVFSVKILSAGSTTLKGEMCD